MNARADRTPRRVPSWVLALFLTVLLWGCSAAGEPSGNGVTPGRHETDTQIRVKNELRFAWAGYRQHAWGFDELRPVSKAPSNWYAEPLGLTIVDALDTLYLTGLKEEYEEALGWIVTDLDFDKDISVSVFEINIRMLGGLISGYLLSGEGRLLDLAVDLADRLLPAFDSPTGMPYTTVNLRTGAVKGADSNPAEVGSLTLEFGMLSALTGQPVYYEKARNAVLSLYDSRSAATGLAGMGIDVESGRITLPISQVGSGIDSYYEYLYKAGVLFQDPELLRRYEQVMAGVDRYLADERNGELWYAYADTETGLLQVKLFGALSCYFGGLLGISGHLDRGERLTASGWKMWDTWGLAPELFLYSNMTLVSGGYELRPEFPESLFYLWRLTGQGKYRDWGERVLDDLIRYCRAEAGYSNVVDVRTMEHGDAMASYFLAETLKYLYLLFDDRNRIDLGTTVFNTEAHPFCLVGEGLRRLQSLPGG